MTAHEPGAAVLEPLRRAARDLLRAAQAAEPAALERLARVPRLSGLTPAETAERAQLADALHVIALEKGAESWPRLKAAVEAGLPVAAQAEFFLRHVRDEQPEEARRWLERTPAIAGTSAFAAAAAGDEAGVLAALASDPALVRARHSQRGFSVLLYACSAPLAPDAPALARIVRALLAAGADANDAYAGEGEGPGQSALYRACIAGHTQVVRALLEHGARTQDGESLYHAAERARFDCLALMLAHGADLSARQEPWGNTPLYFLAGYPESHRGAANAHAGLRWLLEHGADPEVTSGAHGETPLHQVAKVGGGAAIARTLIEHGAHVDARRSDGRTAYVMAVCHGNADVAAVLAEHGADTRLTGSEALLAAVAALDAAGARAQLAADPGLLERLGPDERGMLAGAAASGSVERVRLLVELGFDLAWEGPWGGTALHQAAWRGNVAMVQALLALGAPLEVRDRTYGSSPIAWAAHGSRHCRDADDDYLGIVRDLIAAGAGREASYNKWGEPPEALASERVAGYLRRHFGGGTAG